MEAVAQNKSSLVSYSNPILTHFTKISDRVEINSATYAGIAVKTTYFLIVTLLGMFAQLFVSKMFVNEPIWQTLTIFKFTFSVSLKEIIVLAGVVIVGFICNLVGVFARKTVPVTGSIYSLSQGFLISFLVFKVLVGFEYIGLEALLLTVAIVFVMSFLYSTGIVKVGKRFRTVFLTLLLGSVVFGLLTGLGYLIPFTRPFVHAIVSNYKITLIIDIVGLVIASLFLLSDFETIETCVKEKYPKDYEWSAAFGLVFTVLWIYLKILDLLMRFAGNSKSS